MLLGQGEFVGKIFKDLAHQARRAVEQIREADPVEALQIRRGQCGRGEAVRRLKGQAQKVAGNSDPHDLAAPIMQQFG